MIYNTKYIINPSVFVFLFVFPASLFPITLSEISNFQSQNIELTVAAFTTLSTDDELPLWIHSNRWGVFDHTGDQAGAVVNVSQVVKTPIPGLYFDWKLQGLLSERNHELSGRHNKAFSRLSYGPFDLAFGTLPVEKGLHDGDLSSGSLVMSRNARPVPRIYFGVPDFVSLPRTDGIVEVKGSIAHGWMEEDRVVRSPWLHEKDAYVRINDPMDWGIGIYRGLVHSVMWAGSNADGSRRPDTWSDFVRILTSQSGGDEATVSEQINRLGDTVGMWDTGITVTRPTFNAALYHQHFFEDGSGYRMGRGEDWDERWLRLRDGLTGVSVRLTERRLVNGFTYEYLDTRHQSGPGYHSETGGWDNYWEHGQYGSGWTHHGRVMGPALISVDGAGPGLRFTHTRVVAHHVGIMGWLSDKTNFRVLGTHSRNFGTYRRNVPDNEYRTIIDVNSPDYDPGGGNIRGDDIFRNGRYRWSFLAEISNDRRLFGVESLFGTAAFGLDFGDLGADTAGLVLTIGWRYDQ